MFYKFLWDLWKGTGDYWYNHGMWYINLVCFFQFRHYVEKYSPWYWISLYLLSWGPLQLVVVLVYYSLTHVFIAGEKTPKMKLDAFLARNTSEDSASFAELLKESERKRQLKFDWLFRKEQEQLSVSYITYSFCCLYDIADIDMFWLTSSSSESEIIFRKYSTSLAKILLQ